MHIELAEDLGRVQQMLVVIDPDTLLTFFCRYCQHKRDTYFFALNANRGRLRRIASQYPLITKRRVRKA